MGPEPYLNAMRETPDFDIIVGGRSYDPALYVAFTESCRRKVDPDYDADIHAAARVDGGIMHAGKIMECGGVCADPKSKGAVATMIRWQFRHRPHGSGSSLHTVVPGIAYVVRKVAARHFVRSWRLAGSKPISVRSAARWQDD